MDLVAELMILYTVLCLSIIVMEYNLFSIISHLRIIPSLYFELFFFFFFIYFELVKEVRLPFIIRFSFSVKHHPKNQLVREGKLLLFLSFKFVVVVVVMIIVIVTFLALHLFITCIIKKHHINSLLYLPSKYNVNENNINAYFLHRHFLRISRPVYFHYKEKKCIGSFNPNEPIIFFCFSCSERRLD